MSRLVPLNGYLGRRTNPRHFRQLIAGYLVPAPGIFFGSHLKGLVLLIFFGDSNRARPAHRLQLAPILAARPSCHRVLHL